MAGLFSTHLLSLDALLTVADTIEQHCHCRILKSTSKPAQDHQTAGGEGTDQGSTEETSPTEVDKEHGTSGPIGPPTTGYGMAQRIMDGKDGVSAGRGSRNISVK